MAADVSALEILLASTYTVGTGSLPHYDRFPGKGDLSSRNQGINRFMDGWHVVTPLKRGVVIICKAARNFARARRPIRSTGNKTQNGRFRIRSHGSSPFN